MQELIQFKLGDRLKDLHGKECYISCNADYNGKDMDGKSLIYYEGAFNNTGIYYTNEELNECGFKLRWRPKKGVKILQL